MDFSSPAFLPPEPQPGSAWLSRLAAEPRPVVLYEAPHRIKATLQDLLAAFGDRTVALGRELTKAHEELVVRPISAHLAAIDEGRGEYTLVVGPDEPGPELCPKCLRQSTWSMNLGY